MTAWQPNERVSVTVDGERVWGVVRVVVASQLLRVELPSGRRVWRRA